MQPSFILIILGMTCLLLFAYPYFIYPVILKTLPILPVRRGAFAGRASLQFCVHNEEAALPQKLASLKRLKATMPDLEILVFDDSSTDASAQILSQEGGLLTLVRGVDRCGKAAGMKRLAAMAQGDIIVFTDANVIFADDAIQKLLTYYADENVGGVCGTLLYQDESPSITSEISTSYWSLDERARSLETATGNVMGADGSIFSIRRHLYPDFPDTVLDDLTVSMSVIFQGSRLIKADDVIAYERSVAVHDEEFRRKIRIGARAYHTHSYLRPQLRQMQRIDRFKYASRKQMRWFGGLFLGLAGLCFVGAIAGYSWILAAGALVVAGAAAIVLQRLGTALMAKPIAAATLIFATLYGVILGMTGRTFVTWAPAKSR